MKRGQISVYSGRGMVIGCAGAGKTTLVKKLKGEDMKEDPKSTSGIEIHTHAFKLSSDESTIIGKYLQKIRAKISGIILILLYYNIKV